MSPRWLIPLVAFWQFVFMVDFIAPLPLGPLLSRELGFAGQQVAWLSVSYTLASLVAGVLGAGLVERFGSRRVALAGMLLFAATNLLTGQADSLAELVLCRALAGLTGAPVVATFMALVVQAAPPASRGKAFSMVMSGSSVAAIAGVPLALAVAQQWGWAWVFQSIGLAALVVFNVWCTAGRDEEPASTTRSAQTMEAGALSALWRQPSVRHALRLQGLSQFSTFLLIPVLSTFLVTNRGVTTAQLPLLYVAGGLTAFAGMHVAGRACDRWGHALPLRLACAVLVLAMGLLAWGPSTSSLWAAAAFIAFMAANAAKNIALASYTAGLAPADRRAGFMSLQGSVQDLGILLGGLGPLLLLREVAVGGPLQGMGALAGVAMMLVAVLAFLPAPAAVARALKLGVGGPG